MKILDRIKYDFEVAVAVAINVWKLDLSYPMSALYFVAAPFIWFAPTLVFAYFMAGGRTSQIFGAIAGVDDVITYVTLGSAFTLLMLIGFWSTSFALRKEQWMGTFESVYVTPISRFALILGHSLHSFTHIGAGVLIQIIFIHIIIGLTINVWGIFPALIAVILGFAALQAVGLLLATIVLVAKQGWMASEIVGDVLYILSPVAYPIVILPPLLRALANYNPLYYGTEAFRQFLLYGPFVVDAWYMLLVLAVIDAIGLVIGYAIFLITEKQIRHIGGLNKY